MNKISETKDRIIKSIKNKYQEMTSRQKLIFWIVVVAILILISVLFRNLSNNKSNQEIDYKGMNGEIYYLSGSKIDNNTYATIYTISNELKSKFTNIGEYKLEKDNFDSVYKYIVTSNFSKDYSQKKLFELFKSVYQKIGKSSNANGDVLPDGIVRYNEDYYILRYSYMENDILVNSYIGVYLDTLNNKYYIWYLE